jgi:mRNA interferase MazF
MGGILTQGDIYWCMFKGPDKRRPVLILTRSVAIQFLTGLTVAPITTRIRDIPTEVVLTESDGLFNKCAVNLDNIQTVQKDKVGGFITHLSAQRMSEVAQAIEFAFDLDELRWNGVPPSYV